jgi:ParB family chromosome partitioning protein
MKSVLKRSPLGKGLDVLLPEDSGASSSISEIEVEKIFPNPDQPRQYFEDEALNELADSIRSIGLVQPITVKDMGNDSYMIISGERRWRASKLAQVSSLPAYVVKADDEQVMEMALIENIQREDLNSIEIALAYKRLLEVEGATQESVAHKVGKKRTTVSNYIRLLRLPAEVQLGITEKKIDMGHARALLALETPAEQLRLYQKIVQEGLSVREVERLASGKESFTSTPNEKKAGHKVHESSRELIEVYKPLTQELSRFFGTEVKLSRKRTGQGQLTLSFANEEELIRICQILEKIPR